VKVSVPSQPWQQRRQETQRVIAVWQVKPVSAKAQLEMDELLTEYEKNPGARTPLECLDLIGQYYVPRDGVEACIPIIVMNSVLGWYDALRFGSKSGRAELIDNERLFLRAYLLGGPQGHSKLKELLARDQKHVLELVSQGLLLAEKARSTASYDKHWPSAYGLELMVSAIGENETIKALPEEKWEEAWQDAKKQVFDYYHVKPQVESTPASIAACITLSDRRHPEQAQAQIEQIKKLVAAGADLQALDQYGNPPMIAAAWLIRYDIIYVLLEAGADPLAKNKYGRTLMNEIGRARIDRSSDLYTWRTRVIELLQKRGYDISDDMARLEGRWRVVSTKRDGVELENPPTVYEFSYLALKVTEGGDEPKEYGISLDLGIKPREMALRSYRGPGGQTNTWQNYEIDGDVLRLTELRKNRPGAPPADNRLGIVTVELRRVGTP
jgi:uncharacterized protein (TIGR03067 family)